MLNEMKITMQRKDNKKEYDKQYRLMNKEKQDKNIKEWRTKNKDKVKVIRERYTQNNKEKLRDRDRKYDLKYLYDITLEQYNNILDDQGKVCAICGVDDPGGGKGNFHIDHDHNTGKIRGLLCNRCNMMLGYAKDSIKTLLKATEYLNFHIGEKT